MKAKKLIVLTLLAILLLSTFACGGGGEEEVIFVSSDSMSSGTYSDGIWTVTLAACNYPISEDEWDDLVAETYSGWVPNILAAITSDGRYIYTTDTFMQLEVQPPFESFGFLTSDFTYETACSSGIQTQISASTWAKTGEDFPLTLLFTTPEKRARLSEVEYEIWKAKEACRKGEWIRLALTNASSEPITVIPSATLIDAPGGPWISLGEWYQKSYRIPAEGSVLAKFRVSVLDATPGQYEFDLRFGE